MFHLKHKDVFLIYIDAFYFQTDYLYESNKKVCFHDLSTCSKRFQQSMKPESKKYKTILRS